MEISVFVNDRAVGVLDPGDASVGEVVEANLVHVEPGHVLTTVEVDGRRIDAGSEEDLARLAAREVQRLVLRVDGRDAYVRSVHAQISRALRIVGTKLATSGGLFASGDENAANRLLATVIEELHLTLVLDQQIGLLDGGPVLPVEEVGSVAERLVDAQERRAWPEVRGLVTGRLLPLLGELHELAAARPGGCDTAALARHAGGGAR